MKLLLHSGPGLISKLIKLQTRGEYNHASVLFPDAQVFEAREFKGVVRTPLAAIRRACERDPRLRVDVFECSLPPGGEERARRFLASQLGRRYDYGDVARFVTRRRSTPDAAWFCSELAFAAFSHAGVDLLARTAPWEVSPDMLKRSPHLRAVSTIYHAAL